MLIQVKLMVRWLWSLSLVVGFLCGWKICYAESPSIHEYQVKASFLLKFVKYITYPKEVLSSTTLNICVLGEDPFQGFLEDLMKESKDTLIQGHVFAIRYLRNLDATQGCLVLFISQSEQKQLEKFLAQVKLLPILTVSDIQDFTIRGGMIQLYTLANKISFIIDPTTATEAGLTISFHLLQIAKVTRRPNK